MVIKNVHFLKICFIFQSQQHVSFKIPFELLCSCYALARDFDALVFNFLSV